MSDKDLLLINDTPNALHDDKKKVQLENLATLKNATVFNVPSEILELFFSKMSRHVLQAFIGSDSRFAKHDIGARQIAHFCALLIDTNFFQPVVSFVT